MKDDKDSSNTIINEKKSKINEVYFTIINKKNCNFNFIINHATFFYCMVDY